MRLPGRPDWMDNAACIDKPTLVFFPTVDEHRLAGRPDATIYTAARNVCATCPVKQICLEYAIGHGERFGMWGGLTPHERTTYRRQLGGVA